MSHLELDRSWMPAAACRDMPTDIWFASRPGPGDRGYEDARPICDGCPVKAECLEYALASPWGASHGMWGGLSPRQRRALRRNRKAVRDAEADPYRKSIG